MEAAKIKNIQIICWIFCTDSYPMLLCHWSQFFYFPSYTVSTFIPLPCTLPYHHFILSFLLDYCHLSKHSNVMFSTKHVTQSAQTLAPFPTLCLTCMLTVFWEREHLLFLNTGGFVLCFPKWSTFWFVSSLCNIMNY